MNNNEMPPLYIYYAAFFGIYSVGQVVTGFTDGKKYKIESVEDNEKTCNVSVTQVYP